MAEDDIVRNKTCISGMIISAQTGLPFHAQVIVAEYGNYNLLYDSKHTGGDPFKVYARYVFV